MQTFATDKQISDAAHRLSRNLVTDDVEIISAATAVVPKPVVVHPMPRILVGDPDVLAWHEFAEDSVQMVDRISGGLSPMAVGGSELIRYLTQFRGIFVESILYLISLVVPIFTSFSKNSL